MKVSCALEAIMMFGGSPISVAVPPMFEAMRPGDQERDRVDVERVGDEEGDRRDQQHRGHVVEQRAEHAR